MPGGLLGLFQTSLESAARMLPHRETSWLMTEMANRVEAFSLFENTEALLGPGSANVSLGELFSRASTQGVYRAPWITEGAAHLYSRTKWTSGAEPLGILSQPEVLTDVPANLLTVAHVGLGASLAERVLADIGSTGLEGAIARFRRLCLANAHAGYDQMCVELLGFVTAMLTPGLTNAAAGISARLFPDAEDYFWHGTGRAAYFSISEGIPIPGAHERTIRRIDATRPHAKARANATSGWAWALTLVNIRHPEVVRHALETARRVASHPDAVTEGAESGLCIWTEISPNDGLAAPHGFARANSRFTRDRFRLM